MEIFVNKIVDLPVSSKINGAEIQRILSSFEFPESLSEIDKVVVTFVAREPNDFEFDAWSRNGKVYLTIPLVYEEVLEWKEEEITERCVSLFANYIDDLRIKDELI